MGTRRRHISLLLFLLHHYTSAARLAGHAELGRASPDVRPGAAAAAQRPVGEGREPPPGGARARGAAGAAAGRPLGEGCEEGGGPLGEGREAGGGSGSGSGAPVALAPVRTGG